MILGFALKVLLPALVECGARSAVELDKEILSLLKPEVSCAAV